VNLSISGGGVLREVWVEGVWVVAYPDLLGVVQGCQRRGSPDHRSDGGQSGTRWDGAACEAAFGQDRGGGISADPRTDTQAGFAGGVPDPRKRLRPRSRPTAAQ